MFLMKCYWILQSPRFTTFTLSELLRGNQQWGGGQDEIAPHPPPLSRFSNILFKNNSQDLFDIEVADLIHVREKLFLKFKK